MTFVLQFCMGSSGQTILKGARPRERGVAEAEWKRAPRARAFKGRMVVDSIADGDVT